MGIFFSLSKSPGKLLTALKGNLKLRKIGLCVSKKNPEALEVLGRVKTLTYPWGGC